MYNARRLAVRITFIGWEANITSEHLEYTWAKVANMSTGGAYLITEVEYKPGSIITLWVKSSQLSFFVTAQVLRNDPFGIAVCFLDLCDSVRCSILEIITQFLAKKSVKNLIAEEASADAENHLKTNCYV
jgi:hypothetical protein